MQAARWLALAANKGQYQAQAMLGFMLFKGDAIPRQAARGLMWLTLARDSAGSDEKWINELYDTAFKEPSALAVGLRFGRGHLSENAAASTTDVNLKTLQTAPPTAPAGPFQRDCTG